MRFDFVIGNPPYQENSDANGRDSPIYNYFMDESYKLSDCVELITPARFLFEAGQTPKAWNEKILNDEHFKVLYYEADWTKIFPNTEIKGGIVISLRNEKTIFGKLEIFSKYIEMNSIKQRVTNHNAGSDYFNTIVASQGLYRFSELAFVDFPRILDITGKGTKNKIVSKLISQLPEIFLTEEPRDGDFIKIIGRADNKRVVRYIYRKYVQDNQYIDMYNISCPEANNNGNFGEELVQPMILKPGEGTTDTFLSIGRFKTETEANNAIMYVKTKFLRALLGVYKVTQHTSPSVWKLIPLQDFTSNSDIDWTVSVVEIDKQLYKKYGLTDEEIEFIETNVKEMV